MAEVGLRRFERFERPNHISLIAQPFEAWWHLYTRLFEHPAATGLGPQLTQGRIAGIEWQTELHCQGALEGGGVETGHVRAGGIVDYPANALEQLGPLQDLLGQGCNGTIISTEQG